MAADEIHLGDIGTVFKATIKDGTVAVDISTNSSLQMFFRKPDKTTLTKTATLTGDGTDGIMQYVSVSGDLTPVGQWWVQGHVQLDASNDFKSDWYGFEVFENIV